MALHAKAVPRFFFDLRRRLGRFLKAPLSFVFLKRHGDYCNSARLVSGRAPSPVQAERSLASARSHGDSGVYKVRPRAIVLCQNVRPKPYTVSVSEEAL